ncbi:MAG: hypothetical protein JSR78_07960 [Proteobacteria bacterium]|nr:hypothetical protein [Pseudomonadota bacterium]
MTRRGAIPRSVDRHYWTQVAILDAFWRETFISLVDPLKDFYRDPLVAGTHILSRCQTSPTLVAPEIASAPETFGELKDGSRSRAKDVSLKIAAGPHGMTLAECAVAFAEAREASIQLDRIRLADPTAFAQLQRQRILRNAMKPVETKATTVHGGFSYMVATKRPRAKT